MAMTETEKIEQESLITVKPSELESIMEACILARQNLCVVGPPGCGKSEIGDQVYLKLGRPNYKGNASLEDPTMSGGMPWYTGKHPYAERVPFKTLWQVLTSKDPCGWTWVDFGGAD